MKKKIVYMVLLIMFLFLTACKDPSDGEVKKSETETHVFTDSAGREVTVPKDIERIAPSGPLAQVVLYTLVPDKMVGLSTEFTKDQEAFVDEKYTSLPIFGNFYEGTLHDESLIVAKPQLIIDIGVRKDSIKDDMDVIQENTGIPTVFIEMDMDTMAEAYDILGGLLKEEEQAALLSTYITDTLTEAKVNKEKISEKDIQTVYYGRDNGLQVTIDETVHSDVIPMVGGDNVAKVESTLRGGVAEISFEQLLLWDPDVIILTKDSIYDEIEDLKEWQELEAVKNGKYYEIPNDPYNWVGMPPSVNRILGIKWLGNLLYPTVFEYDMVAEAKEFYRIFYHYDLSEVKAEELLAKSSLK